MLAREWTKRLPSTVSYTATGALLGAAAPFGFLALRAAFARRWPSPRWLGRELRARPITYGYLGLATSFAFALFGHSLGAKEGRLRHSHRELDRLREEFIGIVSHDLKDPIQVLLLQTRMLLERSGGEFGPAAAEVLRRIDRSARRIADVTNDMEDAARIDLGRISLERQPISLPATAAAVVERMRAELAPHPVAVRVEGRPWPVSADRARVEQVLENLLENAAKYSPEDAPIRVLVRPRPARPTTQGVGVLLSVEDRGIGIAPREQALLFDRYYQSQRARERKTGLGIGLHIAKGLVEAHGGRLWVESEVGRGSTFHVLLPALAGAVVSTEEPGAEVAVAPHDRVAEYMNRSPCLVQRGDSLAAARAQLEGTAHDHDKDCLVVAEGGVPVGTVSRGELRAPEGEDAASVPVERVMVPYPLTVGPEAPVREVARLMEARRCTAAVVVEGERVIGLFDSGDALRALSRLYERDAAPHA